MTVHLHSKFNLQVAKTHLVFQEDDVSLALEVHRTDFYDFSAKVDIGCNIRCIIQNVLIRLSEHGN